MLGIISLYISCLVKPLILMVKKLWVLYEQIQRVSGNWKHLYCENYLFMMM